MSSNFLDADLGSDSDDEAFNPEQEAGSDNEVETTNNANGRRGSGGSDDGARKPKNRFGLGDDEEEEDDEDAEGKGEDLDGDDDEDEEEEEDDEEEVDRPRKRLKRRKRNQFID